VSGWELNVECANTEADRGEEKKAHKKRKRQTSCPPLKASPAVC